MADDTKHKERKKSTRTVSTTSVSIPPASQPAANETSASTPLKDKKKSKKHLDKEVNKALQEQKHNKKEAKLHKHAPVSEQLIYKKSSPDSLPEVSGVLYKYNGSFKGWKKRLFHLKDGHLTYFVHNKSRFKVDLQTAVIVTNSKKCRIEIDTGVDILHLRAKTKSDCDTWTNALTETKAMLQKTKPRPSTEVSEGDIKRRLSNRTETLEKTLNLVRSVDSVLASQLELLKAELPAAPAPDAEKKKVKKHSRTKSEQIEATDGQNNFVQQAAEYKRVATKFIEAAEAVLKDFLDAAEQIGKDLEKEKELNMKLKERVKQLRTERGSLRKALQDHELDTATSGEIVKSTEEAVDDEGMEEEHLMIEPITASSSSDESDSDMYYDPVDFDDEFASSSDDEDELADPETNVQPNVSAEELPPKPERRLSKTSIERRASLVIQGSRRGSVVDMQRTSSRELISLPKPIYTVDLADWEATMATVPSTAKWREALPRDKDWKSKVSLFKILKDAVGKDLSRVTLPVQFAEPTNMLQRLVEDLQYCELLHKAATFSDPMLRMLYVAAFAVSSYSSTGPRLTKPFNPILGETFEWVNHEKGFRLFTEQVSHHPPMSACHCEAREWVFWGHVLVKNKFWGKTLEIVPTGRINLTFPKYGDHFIWSKLTTCIHNVLVGTKWIEHYGEMTIINQATNDKVILEFLKRGWWDSNANVVQGGAYDKNNVLKYKLTGTWNDRLLAIPIGEDNSEGEPIELWKVTPLPPHADRQYYFTKFAMQLNDLPDWLKPYLPPTDTRLRPDQRALELGDVDLASSEKFRLEEKQRAARREREQQNQPWKPLFFEKTEDGEWVTNNKYWRQRAARQWPDSPDIF